MLLRRLRFAWPWLTLALVLGVAAWHVVDRTEAAEADFPRVVRPFFSKMAPAAYRLAEPGDTLDRIGLYFSCLALALSIGAILARPGHDRKAWPTALVIALAATWHASTPGPTFDGWHGWGWRLIPDPTAPMPLRVMLGLAAMGLTAVASFNLWKNRATPIDGRLVGLLVVAAVLISARQFDIPGVEPVGYWPRVAFDLGVLSFALALIRARPLAGIVRRRLAVQGLAVGWAVLVAAGVGVTLMHRPLARLHAVVPGKIYISAMPSYLGLSIEQERLRFRTIINLFDEASTEASPRHGEEIRFVREHGLRYLGSPSDGMESDRFLDETLALARDPDAWPILVHCHGCMDRSPAWMGMYRFLVEGRPLDEIFREIEQHRGTRPKAIVTLQYNRKLPARAPERFAADPIAALLIRNASRTPDPFARRGWNRTATGTSAITRIDPDPAIRRP